MKIACLLSAILALLLFVCVASAEETAARTFTNKDLIKNKSGDSPDSSGNNIPKKKTGEGSVGNKDRREKERWCKKGSLHQNRVDDAKSNLQYAESRKKEADSKRPVIRKNRRNSASSDANIRKARLKLEKAERALNNLQQEAHRKNIPPGWLRCQFSY
jgi:hypothetical protein